MRFITVLRAVAFALCAIFAVATPVLAQDPAPKKDVTVQVNHDSKDATSAKEPPPLVQEEEPFIHLFAEGGYMSQFNFRGTNLTPGASGAGFWQLQTSVPRWGLTFGIYGVHQSGVASADTWSISEGGGGGGNARAAVLEVDEFGNLTGNFINAARFPTTRQTKFREIDLFVSYKITLGPIDLTVGNIIFLIDREAETFELDVLPAGFEWANPATGTRFATFGPIPTVENEQFDRVYVRLSTSKIPHITPSISYYQTIYSEGIQRTAPFIATRTEFGDTIFIQGPGKERNDKLGGYLEARVNGNFSIGEWLDINPYGIISYSFKDRTEPAMGSFSGTPLTGFNHAQAGLELDFHLGPNASLVPFAAYSYHFSEPPIGTARHEKWWGLKVAVHF